MVTHLDVNKSICQWPILKYFTTCQFATLSNVICNNQYWSSSATVGTLSKVRRQRQRERHKTKGLMTEQWLCTCVLIFCKFLSRPMQNNNAKWQSSGYFGECERQRLIFHILFWNWTLALHYQTWAISETDRRTEQI